MTVKTTVILAEPCDCGNGYMKDRRLGDRWGCPACDPELGDTPEERLRVYKMLIGTPTHGSFKDPQNKRLGDTHEFQQATNRVLSLFKEWDVNVGSDTERPVIGGIDKNLDGYCLMVFKGNPDDLFKLREFLRSIDNE